MITLAKTTLTADTEPVGSAGIDVSPLVGTWFGIKHDEIPITKIVITERDGVLLLHPYGKPDSDLPDWGETVATGHAADGSTAATGFHATCEADGMRVEFLTVQNQGVLLVQIYISFHDDSGRPNKFAKSYFRRADEKLVASAGISTGVITGDWVNSNSDTPWVAGFTIAEGSDATTIRIRGASEPLDWGEAELTSHADKHGEANLFARYDLGSLEVAIGVISVKNLVVLNQFRRFKDRDVIDTFCREFFFRNR